MAAALRPLALVGLALTLAACTAMSFTRTFPLTLPPAGPAPELPVTVIDQSGLVLDASADVPDAGLPPPDRPLDVDALPGDPRSLIVRWVGGACDTHTELRILLDRTGGITIQSAFTDSGAGCDAMGVERSVLLLLATTYDPDTVITIHGTG